MIEAAAATTCCRCSKSDKNVKLFNWNLLGNQYTIRFNHAHNAVQQSEDPPGRAATR